MFSPDICTFCFTLAFCIYYKHQQIEAPSWKDKFLFYWTKQGNGKKKHNIVIVWRDSLKITFEIRIHENVLKLLSYRPCQNQTDPLVHLPQTGAPHPMLANSLKE